MTDEPDNVVPVLLRRMDQKIDRLVEDVADLKVRMSAVESQIGAIHSRIDRVEVRLDRIEKRLDLAEA